MIHNMSHSTLAYVYFTLYVVVIRIIRREMRINERKRYISYILAVNTYKYFRMAYSWIASEAIVSFQTIQSLILSNTHAEHFRGKKNQNVNVTNVSSQICNIQIWYTNHRVRNLISSDVAKYYTYIEYQHIYSHPYHITINDYFWIHLL